MCLWYLCCCQPGSGKYKTKVDVDSKQQELINAGDPQALQDYDDLKYLAQKREIKVTIRKGTQAGVAAGLAVMAGTIVAGPVGAVAGGAVGTAMAARIAKNVVSLNDLLDETPPQKRGEVLTAFNESFKEEFMDTIQNNAELRLLMGGASIFGVVRYMVDKELLQGENLEKLDGVLKKIKM